MPKGPQSQRPPNVVSNAVKVMRIATGEEEEFEDDSKNSAAKASDAKGGHACARKQKAERR